MNAPHVESTLNWVRIAARFPVRILLDDAARRPDASRRLGGDRDQEMSARAVHRSAPPEVDEGDAPGLAAFFNRELRPTPGRLGDSMRIVAAVLIVVGIAETFRIPDIALSAYIVLFLSGREAVSTVLTALIAGIAGVLAIFATIAVFMLSLSEPALRIPLMAVATFGATFLSRTATLGPVFFAAGFIVAYGLTLGDEVLGLALQPATAGNAPQFELPEIVFVSPEEALVHILLWLSLAVVLPVAVLIAANLLTGRDPARVLRDALAERLATAARFCAGEKGAERQLEAQAFEGTAGLRKLHHLAGLLHHGRRRPVAGVSLIDEIRRLASCCSPGCASRAMLAIRWPPRPPSAARRNARCEQARLPRVEPVAITATGAARPLADAISRTLRAIRDLGGAALGGGPRKSSDAARSPRRLLAADAFSNPEYVRFALKVTLAVMICYFVESLADWPGIHTCVITCFFVALGTVGETLHKATLRFVGCLIGAGLGLGAILLLMPQMTDLGDLLLLLAPVTLLAAWVACGSERIAYAGLQIGLAFYLVVLQGYGPTIDMYTARDRTIGILFGNIVIFVIFTTIWPVSVANVVRTNLAKALEQLATLRGLGRPQRRRDFASRSVRGQHGRSGRRSRRHARSWSTIRSKQARCGALPGGGRSTRLWWSRSVGCSSRSRRSSICIALPAGRELPQPTRDAILRASPGAGGVVSAGSVMGAQRRGSGRGGRRPAGTADPIRPG